MEVELEHNRNFRIVIRAYQLRTYNDINAKAMEEIQKDLLDHVNYYDQGKSTFSSPVLNLCYSIEMHSFGEGFQTGTPVKTMTFAPGETRELRKVGWKSRQPQAAFLTHQTQPRKIVLFKITIENVEQTLYLIAKSQLKTKTVTEHQNSLQNEMNRLQITSFPSWSTFSTELSLKCPSFTEAKVHPSVKKHFSRHLNEVCPLQFIKANSGNVLRRKIGSEVNGLNRDLNAAINIARYNPFSQKQTVIALVKTRIEKGQDMGKNQKRISRIG